MTKYTLYTEYREFDRILRILKEDGFSGATLTQGIGVFNHEQEDCLVITIIESPYIWDEILELARKIKRANHQYEVLVTMENLANMQTI